MFQRAANSNANIPVPSTWEKSGIQFEATRPREQTRTNEREQKRRSLILLEPDGKIPR